MRPLLDLHGETLEDALKLYHQFVGGYMLEKEPPMLEIITGQGVIKDAIIKELNKMEIEYMIRAHNLGSVVIVW